MSDPAEAASDEFVAAATGEQAFQAYRALVQAIDDAVVQLDAAGRVIAADDAFLELAGRTREVLLGEDVSLAVDEDGRRRIERALTPGDGVGDGRDERFEVAVGALDGGRVRCEVDLTPLVDGGELRGAVGIVREIGDGAGPEDGDDADSGPDVDHTATGADVDTATGIGDDTATGTDERRDLERELEERERQLSRLMDNVPGMVYRCRNERGWPMEFVSDACREITGYDPEALERGDVEWGADVMVEADRELLWETVQRETATGETFTETYRIETADGETRWVRDYGRGIFEDGEAVAIEGIVSDVTERKRAERQLAEERDMFADGPTVVFRWAPDAEAGWPVEYVSGNVEEVLGYAPEEFESGAVAYADLLFDEELDRIEREVEAHADGTTERFSREPYRVKTNDGEVRWVRDVTKIVRNESGEITNYLGYLVDITERRERERELEEYETIVETVNDGVYVVDEDGRFSMVNDAYVEMTGYDRDELLGEHVSLVADEETVERARRMEDEIRRDDADSSTIEAELRTADGERLPSEATFAMLSGPDGRERRVGVARDISKRKARERQLQRNKEQLETLFEVLPVGVVVAEADGEIVAANDTAREIWGGDVFDAESVDEYDQHPVRWADSGEPVPPEEMTLARVIDGEEVTDRDVLEIETLDGERRIVELAGMPIRDESGDVVRGVVTMTDVTERRETQRQLEESERRYRTLAEHFPEGAVALFDESLQYTAMGGQLMDEVGVSMDDRVGERVSALYPDDLVAEIEPHFEAALDGESSTFEVEFHDRHLYAHTLPVTDADDEIVAGMLLVRDVTERREYERRLEASNERLEQFAYAASHDLQEPLRMVSSYLQLIENRYADELDAEGREFLSFAVDGADRMREMIDALLEYSRVDTKGDPFEPVDLADVLAAVREDLGVKIAEHDAELTAGSLPTVEGDPNQLRQLFQNLVDNAIEYSGDEPPRVEITAQRVGDEWVVSVSDDGIGIEPAEQDRIFEVFHRLHSHDDHSGTGIGLALCERIVERHGGEIHVESAPGEGTTVSVALPAGD